MSKIVFIVYIVYIVYYPISNCPIFWTSIQAIRIIKENLPQLLVAADVCLCPFSSTGHCSIFTGEGRMDNQASINRLAQIALAYAKAGCDVIAPSGKDL